MGRTLFAAMNNGNVKIIVNARGMFHYATSCDVVLKIRERNFGELYADTGEIATLVMCNFSR